MHPILTPRYELTPAISPLYVYKVQIIWFAMLKTYSKKYSKGNIPDIHVQWKCTLRAEKQFAYVTKLIVAHINWRDVYTSHHDYRNSMLMPQVLNENIHVE